jgi:hypothetical protein
MPHIGDIKKHTNGENQMKFRPNVTQLQDLYKKVYGELPAKNLQLNFMRFDDETKTKCLDALREMLAEKRAAYRAYQAG